jgi:Fur family transcriptional regulator, iron response regulator
MTSPWTTTQVQRQLREAGVLPTLQRLVVATVLLHRPRHLTAEQVLTEARERMPEIARATVYATLQLFVRHGLLKELPIEGAATVFDSNTAPHHHLYDVDTGEVSDLPQEALRVLGLPDALGGFELAGVDVIVRVRKTTAAPAAPVHCGAEPHRPVWPVGPIQPVRPACS